MKLRIPLAMLASIAAANLFAQQPQLEISGADAELAANLHAHVRLPDAPCEAELVSLRRFLPGIRQRILRAGRALGYYRLQYTSQFQAVAGCWQLSIDINPGEPVTIANVDVAVSGDESVFTRAIATLPVAIGDQLDQSRYEAIKSELSSLAVENGFFSARFEQSELRLDLDANSAEILIRFDPGERFLIGEIRMPELDVLDGDFIERYFPIATGQPYSTDAILALRQALTNSMYFDRVSVTPAIDESRDGSIPIDVGLVMRPRIAYSAGVGVTTDIGPRFRVDHENRYLNGDGHSTDSQLGISPVQQSIDLMYRLPMDNPGTESLALSGGFLREDTDAFENETTKLGASYSFVNRFNWLQDYFLEYQYDEFLINDEQGVSNLLIPGVSLSRTRADDALFPNRGWRLYGELKGASNALLSDQSFLQLNFAGKYIRRLGPGRVLFKLEAGTSWVDDLTELPASIRYFSGGDQTVRGYKYGSLGPVADSGEVTGGKHTFAAGVEYDFSISENWKLALFVDSGNAFNSFADMDLKTGAGLGLRWLSPIGPVRVDLASALDDDNRLRLHITMGPDL